MSSGEPTPNEDDDELRRQLSGLHRMSAPQKFEADVEETIHRRSGGRFFGRKAFGDRVPFVLIGMVVIALGLVVFSLLRCSDTGSLRYDRRQDAPNIHPEARDQMPTPRTE
jgi:hypothetical protein